MLSEKEIERYQRHISLSQIGKEGQKKLKAAKVLVIGAGGLGCPVLSYLTAAGIGYIGIVDDDVVSISNLQRQTLYAENDINRPKVEVAKEKLLQQNSSIQIKIYTKKLTENNANELISTYDIVVDCTDSIPARYYINDASKALGKPMVYGAIHGFEGQLAVLNYNNGPSYRCIFPTPQRSSVTCNDTGVLGVLPGIIGTLQANEVLKLILSIGEITTDLLLFNSLNYSFNKFKINCSEEEQSIQNKQDNMNIEEMKQITREELFQNLDNYLILDVREHWEKPEIEAPNVIQCALDDLDDIIEELPYDKEIAVICQTGGRSSSAVLSLANDYGYKNLTNVVNGLIG